MTKLRSARSQQVVVATPVVALIEDVQKGGSIRARSPPNIIYGYYVCIDYLSWDAISVDLLTLAIV